MSFYPIVLMLSVILAINGFTYKDFNFKLYDLTSKYDSSNFTLSDSYKGSLKKIIKRKYLATKVNNKILKGTLMAKTVANVSIYGAYKSKRKYDTSGNILSETYFIYDKMSREIERKTTENSQITHRIKKIYSGNGNLYKEFVYTNNKLSKLTVKKYENKLLKERIIYKANNQIKSKTIYTYTNSQLQERKYYLHSKRKKALFLAYVNVYNKQGDVIKYISYDSDGKIEMITTSEYRNGLHKKNFVQNKKDSPKILSGTLKYNKNGQLLKTIVYDAKGKVTFYEKYRYDKQGNPIELIIYFGYDGLLIKYIDVYDKHGNSIKQIEIRNGVPKYIITHEYEYY